MSENQDIRWVFQFLGDYGQHDSSFHRNILILSYSSKNYGSGKGTLPRRITMTHGCMCEDS